MNLIVILIFVVLNEAIIEYFIGNIKSLRIYIPLLSLATAILLAFGYQVSLFHIFLGTEVINPFFDSPTLTGLTPFTFPLLFFLMKNFIFKRLMTNALMP